MLQKLRASDWQFYSPKGSGEKRNCQIDLKGVSGVSCEIRCDFPAELKAITTDGHTLLLGWGQVVSFTGRLEGFAALEIVSEKPFAFRASVNGAWFEVPDQTKLTIDHDEKASTPVENLVRNELKRVLGQMAARDLFASDVALEELLEDIDKGDLDFEAEEDPFGLGFEEPEEETIPTPPKKPAKPSPSPKITPEPEKPISST
ncbi:MAG: hypothetical protein [Microvirus sp.]|nr:MAG: hypothetical protein [Microvirus sp.]